MACFSQSTRKAQPIHVGANLFAQKLLRILARIYETLPLVCPLCQSQMHIIAFITEGSSVRKILDHIGESAVPPKVAPARGPPLWELAQAQRHRADNDSQWESAAQPEPVFEFDQRVVW